MFLVITGMKLALFFQWVVLESTTNTNRQILTQLARLSWCCVCFIIPFNLPVSQGPTRSSWPWSLRILAAQQVRWSKWWTDILADTQTALFQGSPRFPFWLYPDASSSTCAASSAQPLDYRWYDSFVICLMSFLFKKCLKSALTRLRPLWLKTTARISCVVNIVLDFYVKLYGWA